MKTKLLFAAVLLLFIGCEPEPTHHYKWEITVQHGVVGYFYDCESYKKIGNTYYLYEGKKIIKIIDAGSSTILIEPHHED